MMEHNNYISGSLEYRLKYYQMIKEIEDLREKSKAKKEELNQINTGSQA